MKKILTESEITDFLNKYCPETTLTCRLGVMYVENKEIGILRETNGSNVSLKCIAYEYAFVKYATEKFEYIEFPTHIYRNYTEPANENSSNKNHSYEWFFFFFLVCESHKRNSL